MPLARDPGQLFDFAGSHPVKVPLWIKFRKEGVWQRTS